MFFAIIIDVEFDAEPPGSVMPPAYGPVVVNTSDQRTLLGIAGFPFDDGEGGGNYFFFS